MFYRHLINVDYVAVIHASSIAIQANISKVLLKALFIVGNSTDSGTEQCLNLST